MRASFTCAIQVGIGKTIKKLTKHPDDIIQQKATKAMEMIRMLLPPKPVEPEPVDLTAELSVVDGESERVQTARLSSQVAADSLCQPNL